RVADVRFVLDELGRLDEDGPGALLAGRLDLARVGVFGHSFGGAVAAEACRADPRIRCAADLDGLIFGEAARTGVGKPFLFFADDTRVPRGAGAEAAPGPARRRLSFLAANARRIRVCLAGVDGCWLTLRGTRHTNFCDNALFSPLRRLTQAGPIAPE